jgi:uncharacterized membrane protein
MKTKKIILLLLCILGFLLIYNYFLAPVLMQYNNQMGMGMHMRMYNNYNYFIDSRFILVIVIVIAGILTYEFIRPKKSTAKCKKCGREIEDEHWRACPQCGTPIESGRGEVK